MPTKNDGFIPVDIPVSPEAKAAADNAAKEFMALHPPVKYAAPPPSDSLETRNPTGEGVNIEEYEPDYLAERIDFIKGEEKNPRQK